MKETINVFFSVDDNYLSCAYVSIYSLIKNANKSYNYNVNILYDSETLCEESKKVLNKLSNDNTEIKFCCVDSYIEKIKSKFITRDYYTNTIYYRLFIPNILKQEEKAIYLDCDTIITGDISELYNVDVTGKILAACSDEAVIAIKVFQDYTEQVIGVNHYLDYFNSGVMLLNLKEFNKQNLYERFLKLLDEYPFVVAPDQDCLNVICKDKVVYLDKGWNRNPLDIPVKMEKLNLIHYNLTSKPWHYKGIMFEEYFWEYAKETPFYQELLDLRDNYPEECKQRDKKGGADLLKKAQEEIDNPNNYKKIYLN